MEKKENLVYNIVLKCSKLIDADINITQIYTIVYENFEYLMLKSYNIEEIVKFVLKFEDVVV